MDRQRSESPDIEIIEEIKSNKPLVEVVLPKLKPSPAVQLALQMPTLHRQPQQIGPGTSFKPVAVKNTSKPAAFISPVQRSAPVFASGAPPAPQRFFRPGIQIKSSVLTPNVGSKVQMPTGVRVIVPGPAVTQRPDQQQFFNTVQRNSALQQHQQPQRQQPASSGATVKLVVGNLINPSQFNNTPKQVLPGQRIQPSSSYNNVPNRKLVTSSKNIIANTVVNVKQTVQIHSSVPKRQRKRKRYSSTSSSSSSIAVDNESFQARSEKLPKLVSKNPSFQFPFSFYGRYSGNELIAKDSADDPLDRPFQCHICDKILSNNVSMMFHAFAHYLHDDRGRDEDLTDVSTCWICLRLFMDPYRLMDHVNQIHKKKSTTMNAVKGCYICELEFERTALLEEHMATVHKNNVDMPYNCGICKFQSSLYDDVIDHFCHLHQDSLQLLCPLCLYVTKGTYDLVGAIYPNVAGATIYGQHLQCHMEKETLRCDCCRLLFFSNQDLQRHKSRNHNSHAIVGEKLGIVFDGCRPFTIAEQRGQTKNASRKVTEFVKRPFDDERSRCVECRRLLTDEDHFFKDNVEQCVLCKFATSCRFAYTLHVNEHAKNGPSAICRSIFKPMEPVLLDTVAVCNCGFQSCLGNRVAEHVTSCYISMDEVILKPDVLTDDTLIDWMPKEVYNALDIWPTMESAFENDSPIVEEEKDSATQSTVTKLDAANAEDGDTKDLNTSRSHRLSLLSPAKKVEIAGYRKNRKSETKSAKAGKKNSAQNNFSLSAKRTNMFAKGKFRMLKAVRLAKNVETLCSQYDQRRLQIPNEDILFEAVLWSVSSDDEDNSMTPPVVEYYEDALLCGNRTSSPTTNGSNFMPLDNSQLDMIPMSPLSSDPVNIFDILLT